MATIRVFFPAPEGPYTRRCGKSPLCAWNASGYADIEVKEHCVPANVDVLKDHRGNLVFPESLDGVYLPGVPFS